MLLQQSLPGSGLERWIHSYRHYTFTAADSLQFTCLPGTGAELWLLDSGDLGDSLGPLRDGLLCLRSRQLRFLQVESRVFAIRFRAGSLPFFFDRPLAELIDRFTPVNALCDETAVQHLTGVRRSPHFDEQCRLAERFLVRRLRSGRGLEQMQRLANVIYEESADFALSDYAGRLQRDRSHLSRQFHDIQGTSAKYFHRLCRFERFLRDALFAAESSLAGLAIEHGYYDQAHMYHDVRLISQQPPRALLARDETRLFYAQRPRQG